ncbi:hypothetical protein A3780_03715 [Kosakonia radicincitans]|nr:hypothetical protein A3780_03715 [Kosakonia radicincitans]
MLVVYPGNRKVSQQILMESIIPAQSGNAAVFLALRTERGIGNARLAAEPVCPAQPASGQRQSALQ